jgi:mono/diheme cytochrome c family protein
MNRWLKRGALVLAGLAGSAALVVLAAQPLAERRMRRVIDVPVQPVAYRNDAASVERGRYLFNSRGCAECHGADGAGRVFAQGSDGLSLKAPNISPGAGNVVGDYTPADWVRTLRHGVKPDGRPALIMPSEDYARFTDADLAALVAYVRQLPPAAGAGAVLKLPVPAKALYALGLIPDAAEKIDHGLPPAQPVAEGVNLQPACASAAMARSCRAAGFPARRPTGPPPPT